MLGVLQISRFDAFLYDVTLQEKDAVTGDIEPLEAGNVQSSISLWPPSLTPIAGTTVQMSHVSDGRWLGELQSQQVAVSFAAIADNTAVAIIYSVNGVMVRYREAVIVSVKRSEAL